MLAESHRFGRWVPFGVFAVASLAMLLASSLLGPAGWAVVMVLGHPLLALALAAWDTVRRSKWGVRPVNWLWCVVPPLVQAVEILIVLNATALPFAVLTALGGALGLAVGSVIVGGRRRRT